MSGKQVTLDFVSQYYKVHNNNLKPQWKEYTNLKYLSNILFEQWKRWNRCISSMTKMWGNKEYSENLLAGISS